MAKKKRKIKFSKGEVRGTVKFPIKKALILLLCTAAAMAVYYLAANLGYSLVMPIYVIGAGALFVIYYFLNRGLMKIPKPEELTDEMTKDEKEAFIAEAKLRKKKSEWLLYAFVAIVFTLAADLTYLFVTLNLGLSL